MKMPQMLIQNVLNLHHHPLPKNDTILKLLKKYNQQPITIPHENKNCRKEYQRKLAHGKQQI